MKILKTSVDKGKKDKKKEKTKVFEVDRLFIPE